MAEEQEALTTEASEVAFVHLTDPDQVRQVAEAISPL